MTVLVAACKKTLSLEGFWESSSALSYEFGKSTYIRKTNLIFTVAEISGSYHFSDKELYMTVEKISYDDGKTWQENDGEIFPLEEQIYPLSFNPDGTISISNIMFSKSK